MHLSASFAEKNSAAVDTSNGVWKSSGAIETTCVSQAVLLACLLRSLMSLRLSFTSSLQEANTQLTVWLLTSANNMTARGRTLSSSEVRGGPIVSICDQNGIIPPCCYARHTCMRRQDMISRPRRPHTSCKGDMLPCCSTPTIAFTLTRCTCSLLAGAVYSSTLAMSWSSIMAPACRKDDLLEPHMQITKWMFRVPQLFDNKMRSIVHLRRF